MVDRIDAVGPGGHRCPTSNLVVNHITSQTSIDLQAQDAILDAFPAHQGLYVNVHIPESGRQGM